MAYHFGNSRQGLMHSFSSLFLSLVLSRSRPICYCYSDAVAEVNFVFIKRKQTHFMV